MLVNFSVTNFLSFNQKTTFKMESGRVTKKPDHLLEDSGTGKSLLKFSAMFGKNGAGKTNFIRAVAVLRNFVLQGKLPQRAPDLWCKLEDQNASLPTEFEITFIADKNLYEYRVSVVLATGIITKEELTHVVGNRHTKLFYKEGGADSPYIFHHSIKGPNKDIEVLSRTFAMSGTPFLFSINHNTGGFFMANPHALVVQKTFLWFKDTLEVIFPDQPLQETSLLQYEICKDEFAQLLKDFDTGIEGIRLEPVSKEKVFETLDLRTQQKLNLEMALVSPLVQFAQLPAQLGLPQNAVRKYSTVIRSRRNIFIITLKEDKAFHFYAVKFVHNLGGKEIEFSMESESDGTHRLFQLLEILISKKEKVYIMDEINRSLHPKLTVQFVKKYFLNAKDRRIQLVTTTHESRLMSHDIVRRDEIWIADKNDDDSTKLFSLEDEQVRIDKVLDQNYMDNVWGGVPVFKDEEETHSGITPTIK